MEEICSGGHFTKENLKQWLVNGGDLQGYLFQCVHCKSIVYILTLVDHVKRTFSPFSSFQRDRKPLQTKKDEYWRGANFTFVSTSTQD
ncbi:CbrC family protein [Bacillus altitudinis]|uniref:CbrC family protein n=1 Tax=Bacillus altitudinis TaxID=293387 RepID=UPI0029BA402E|nr:CbrC family protein [Bacillus altitudinis]MDX2364303.1 CbrC family protein [Bacillus altitudinis]